MWAMPAESYLVFKNLTKTAEGGEEGSGSEPWLANMAARGIRVSQTYV